MWRLIFLLAIISCTPKLQVQHAYADRTTISKSTQNQLDQAQGYIRAGRAAEAINLLKKVLEHYPALIDAHMLLGGIYYSTQDMQRARQHLERAHTLNPDYNRKIAFTLGLVQYELGEYNNSIRMMEAYLLSDPPSASALRKAKKIIDQAQKALELSEQNHEITIQRLPPQINSVAYEYLPGFTLDGETMIFTRRQRDEDFYQSKQVDGTWQEATPLDEINTSDNEGAHCISADGKLLIFTGCNRRDGLGSCDLYFSVLRQGKWSSPRNMGDMMNTAAWESQPSLSADGKKLYFSSNRPGGLGGKDIWVSVKNNRGLFGAPKNLGAPINSPGDELTPFIHADSETLYFTSDGHPGLGKTDLFLSHRREGEWSEPMNMGTPINTPLAEGALALSIDGSTAYFTRNQSEDSPATDIFYFEMPTSLRPHPVTYVKIKLIDDLTEKTIPNARVKLIHHSKVSDAILLRTDEQGQFIAALKMGNDYGLNISHDGYVFYSNRFVLTSKNQQSDPYVLDVRLTPIKNSDTLDELKPTVLKNVFFDSGSYTLKPSSDTELELLLNLLKNNPSIRIQINGHTDDIGSEKDNLELSTLRAKAVRDHLVRAGIDSKRVLYQGYGETAPIADNSTEEGRKINRRTTFIILK